jgi:hypothetical protein
MPRPCEIQDCRAAFQAAAMTLRLDGARRECELPQKTAPIAQSSELIVKALQRSLLRSARNLRTRVRLISLMAYGASFGKS